MLCEYDNNRVNCDILVFNGGDLRLHAVHNFAGAFYAHKILVNDLVVGGGILR